MPKNSETSTIMLYVTTKAELDNRKVHPNQSYDEVIQHLLHQTEKEASDEQSA